MMTFFDELKASLTEAVAVKDGTIRAARVTRHDGEESRSSGRRKKIKRSIQRSGR